MLKSLRGLAGGSGRVRCCRSFFGLGLRYVSSRPKAPSLEPTENMFFEAVSEDSAQYTGFVKPKDTQPVASKRPMSEEEELLILQQQQAQEPIVRKRVPPARRASESSEPSARVAPLSQSAEPSPTTSSADHSEPKPKTQKQTAAREEIVTPPVAPYMDVSKEEMWRRLRQKVHEQAEETIADMKDPTEIDYLKIETDLKDEDRFHWRLGQVAVDNPETRKDFYALHALALTLNKTRWKSYEVQNIKGMGSMGAAMRRMFWKDACDKIINAGEMCSGSFVEGNPVLRPFAAIFHRHSLTKAFLRGFVEARLRPMQQPGNMRQLLDYFDKSHGMFFNSVLQILGVHDEHAEHVMMHVGRAVGLTQHTVLLWRRYAELGFTMLPADICADNHVNLALLRNVALASEDKCVRQCLFEVMSQVKAEMDHVRDLMKYYPTGGWPLLFETFYPNYFTQFLLKHDFDVRKRFAEDPALCAGVQWYSYKKNRQWNKKHDIDRLVAEEAPFPFRFPFRIPFLRSKTSKYPKLTMQCSFGR